MLDLASSPVAKAEALLPRLTDATPAEIDDVIFDLWAARWQAATYAAEYRNRLAKSVWPEEYKAKYESHVSRWNPSSVWAYVTPYEVIRAVETLNDFQAQLTAIHAALEPLTAEYYRRGCWTRYILVGGGHLHSEWEGCGSLRPTTQRMLLAESSGLTADEVIAKYSYTACTKCFPGAPVRVPEVDPKACPADQGVEDIKGSLRLYRPYGRCRVCAQVVSVTSTGKIRKHKKEA